MRLGKLPDHFFRRKKLIETGTAILLTLVVIGAILARPVYKKLNEKGLKKYVPAILSGYLATANFLTAAVCPKDKWYFASFGIIFVFLGFSSLTRGAGSKKTAG